MKFNIKKKYVLISILCISTYFLVLGMDSINKIRYEKKALLKEVKNEIHEGKYDLAEEKLDKVIMDKYKFTLLSRADKFNIYNYLGVINMFQGETVNAVQMYEKADEYVSVENKYKIDINSAIAYRHMGEYLKSAELLMEIIKLEDKNNPNDARIKTYALLNLAEIYLHVGNMDEFSKILMTIEKYIDKLPESNKDDLLIMCYSDLIIRDLYNNKFDNIDNYFNKINELESDNYEIFYTENKMMRNRAYAIYYKKIGNIEKAIQSFKELEKYGQKEGDSYISQFAIRERIDIYKKIGNNFEYNKLIKRYYDEDQKITILNDKQYKFHLNNMMCEDNKVDIMKKTIIMFILINVVLVIIVILIYQNMRKTRLDSMRDGLCNIYNRRYLEFYKRNAKHKDFPISVLMIDVDYFKLYNDNYGHQKGDEVLKCVAKILENSCRENDMVFRYGGEEFCVILKDMLKEESIIFVKRIKENISQENIKHEYSTVNDYITVSIGISSVYSKENLKDAINSADKALYISKENGRNKYTHIENI